MTVHTVGDAKSVPFTVLSTASPAGSGLLHSRDAAKYLGVSEAWLARERWKGTGVAYVRVGGPRGRAVRYRREDIDSWVAINRVTPAKGGDDVRTHG
ncbi:MAG: helix-turn-helix transcriptional regulator [Beijerinckiaceae bacterium]